jgi:hypothetical protein
VLTNLIGFWRSFVGVGNTGGAGVVSSRLLRWLGLGGEIIFVVGFWWLCDILSTSLTNLVCPKSITILRLTCLDHHPKLRLMTRQPTHQLSQLIILILQTINIMRKFQILQSMHFIGRASVGIGSFSLASREAV